MTTLTAIGLLILVIIIIIGIIRTIFTPANNIIDFFMQLMLLDWLINGLSWLIEDIYELWGNDWD